MKAERQKRQPKNCKWPIELNDDGLPKEYFPRNTKSAGRHRKRSLKSRLNSIEEAKWRREHPDYFMKPLPWRAKLWARLSMEVQNTEDAAVYAYELQGRTDASKFAHAITNRNRSDPRVHEYTKEIAEKMGKNILDLADNAENEGVRLAASKDVLDRLGLRAPQVIEIDDKRELTPHDLEAIDSVIGILSGEVQEAEIMTDEHEKEETPV